MSITVSNGWSLKQLDVNNAFLQVSLTNEVYMVQPLGFVDKDNPHHICKLSKTNCGLKQAPRAWFNELSAFLFKYGFKNTTTDALLFVYKIGNDILYFLVYVNDLILIGNNNKRLAEFLHKLSHAFSLKDLGTLNYFLCVKVISIFDGLFLNQQRYILDLLDMFAMMNVKPTSTSMATTVELKLMMDLHSLMRQNT